MSDLVHRLFSEPKRQNLTWAERWKGPDRGLINCWEIGRELATKEPQIAVRAKEGELPVSAWKGGVEKTLKKKSKFGTLFYLAEWQGLRGEDLRVDLNKEVEITCARTGVTVVFTNDSKKYGNA